jgi:hypothetical protein
LALCWLSCFFLFWVSVTVSFKEQYKNDCEEAWNPGPAIPSSSCLDPLKLARSLEVERM